MKPITRIAIGVAAGALVVAGTVPATADAGKPAGALQINLMGLPAAADLEAAPSLQVVGPTNLKKNRTWTVHKERTLKGLRPGTYAVQAQAVRTISGQTLRPESPVSWYKVTNNKVKKATVQYSDQVIEGLPPERITNMNKVCRDLFGRGWGSGYRSYNDPMSLYCYDDNNTRDTRGINLEGWCVREYGLPATYAFLQGNTVDDWYCFIYKWDPPVPNP